MPKVQDEIDEVLRRAGSKTDINRTLQRMKEKALKDDLALIHTPTWTTGEDRAGTSATVITEGLKFLRALATWGRWTRIV